MTRPLIVIGGNSVIGSALAASWRKAGESTIATTRSDPGETGQWTKLDLAADYLPKLPSCRAAVLCASVTRQDQCRLEPSKTRHINVVQTERLARELAAAGAFVVFLSSNLVFDGSQPFRRAHDPLNPKTEYGRQKAEAELALASLAKRVAIVRLTKVFHPGQSLLHRWVQDVDAGKRITSFSDYVCSPLELRQVVQGISQIVTMELGGIWQFSGPAEVSYADLARRVCAVRHVDPNLVNVTSIPLELVEHNPAHTTLDTSRANEELGLAFPNANEILGQCLESPVSPAHDS